MVKRQSGRSSGVEHNLAKVGVEGSNPFARSRNLQTVEKPSFLPSQTVDSSVCYTKLLHSGSGRLGAKPLNGQRNRQNFCYTILLHNSRGGLVRRSGWFHFRRRVPDALRTVFGRSEIWVSLKTSNEGQASIRGRTVATAIEGEFARAWADNTPSTLPMIGARNALMLKSITSTVSARLSEVRRSRPIPANFCVSGWRLANCTGRAWRPDAMSNAPLPAMKLRRSNPTIISPLRGAIMRGRQFKQSDPLSVTLHMDSLHRVKGTGLSVLEL